MIGKRAWQYIYAVVYILYIVLEMILMYLIYPHDMPYLPKPNETSNDYEYTQDKSVCLL